MSPRTHSSTADRSRAYASVFAALGDRTRLALVAKLSGSDPRSISQLTSGSRMTRQAITKHLRILEDVGLVRNVRAGRESLFEFNPQPIVDAARYLEHVSRHWDHALARLKAYVEK